MKRENHMPITSCWVSILPLQPDTEDKGLAFPKSLRHSDIWLLLKVSGWFAYLFTENHLRIHLWQRTPWICLSGDEKLHHFIHVFILFFFSLSISLLVSQETPYQWRETPFCTAGWTCHLLLKHLRCSPSESSNCCCSQPLAEWSQCITRWQSEFLNVSSVILQGKKN